ncbi:MAG: dipeptidase [Verrucomicrobia bacterium]|nr:dipeptidase [Verrucomicrobiota bacterium]
MIQPRLLVCFFLAAFCALRAETEAELAARAAALHARLFTIDTHVDTPTLSLRRTGWDISLRHEARKDFSQLDFPRMREGGLKAAVFAVYVDQGPRTPEGYAAVRDNALRSFLRVREMAARHPGECELALSAADGRRIAAAGRRAIFLSVENGYAVGKDLTLLQTYREFGMRFFGFVHNGNNDLADSSQPGVVGPEWEGLSPLGREAVKECNRLGLVIDGSHASDETVRQLLALSQTPIVLTHSGCAAIRQHRRNVSDELLREIAAKGGVIQVNMVSLFLIDAPPNPELESAAHRREARASGRKLTDAEDAELSVDLYRIKAEKTKVRATIDGFLKHLFHAIDVAGADHVGIGADMDGGGGVTGIEDVADYPKITLALLKRGLSDADVEKIWGGNTLRVLRAAEELARAQSAKTIVR